MGLENLRSVFQENIEKLAETFSSNRPQDRNDSKFVFNDVISQTHTFGVTTQEPILDTLLRGRIYQPGSFNPTLIDKALFVEPETPPFINQNFKNETYDPRVPKNEGIQINNTGFQLNQDFNHFATAGLDGAPFTPLSELGVSFYNGNANNANNLSWQRLYTSDHRAKNNPSWQGISAVNYGPNVNRDKLDIRDSKSNSSFFSPSRNSIIDNLDYARNQKINYSEFIAATINVSEFLTDEKLEAIFKTFDDYFSNITIFVGLHFKTLA